MRRFAFALMLTSGSTVALADAVTTRIETRPYYGAVVTIEQGVRVWRALPPHDRIIIVPEGAAKVNVNIDTAAAPRAATAFAQTNTVNVTSAGGAPGVGFVGAGPARRYARTGWHAPHAHVPRGGHVRHR